MRWYDFPCPRLFSIKASDNFLQLVAQEVFAGSGAEHNPAALADARIFVPNSRIARALAEALLACARQLGRSALILPRIEGLGHLDEAVDEQDFGRDSRLCPELAPPVPEVQRRAILAQFVQTLWKSEKRPALSAVQALAAGEQLAQMLDLAESHGGADWEALQAAVSESHLASHWEINAKFLQIVAKHWPDWLAEHNFSDAATRQRLVADALAQSWTRTPPLSPVLILGSTGATQAARILMKAAMELRQGAVLLPALDREARDEDWQSIAQTPGHPQHVLQQTLAALEIEPASVHVWPGSSTGSASTERARFINEALVPADTTGDWRQRLQKLAGTQDMSAFTRRALSGLKLVTGDHEGQTARIAALILRNGLEQEGKTGALVTPDPVFARRVSALLKRWQIEVTPSIGTPLLLSRTGRFFSALLPWLEDAGDPVLLLTLLKHSLCRLGREAAAVQAAVCQIEMGALRGARRHKALEALAESLRAEAPQAAALLRDAALALKPLLALRAGPVLNPDIIPVLAKLAEDLAAPLSPWAGPDGVKCKRLLEKMRDMLEVWHDIPPHALTDLFETLAQEPDMQIMVFGSSGLEIWGQLEARLQHADVLVLAGLNEGTWPRQLPESWLPRRLRIKAGLPDPEERVGLAAHDFAQLACQSDVWLLRSARSDDGPAIASRWWWRLTTLAEAGLGQDRLEAALAPDPSFDPKAIAKAMMRPAKVSPATPPEPRPPAHLRPRTYSMTRARALISDPFTLYARDILKLRPLNPVGAGMQARDKGMAIHEALEALESPALTAEALTERIGQCLIESGLPETLFAMRRGLWRQMAQTCLDWRAGRPAHSVCCEIKGELSDPAITGDFTLEARADRIEQIAPDQYAIIDFKTGSLPYKETVKSGLDPQMLLQAAMLNHGGFADLHGQVSEILHYRFHDGKQDGDYEQKISIKQEQAEQVLQDFLTLARTFADSDQPFLSRPDTKLAPYPSDYDRLARRAEWAAEIGEADTE